jgi:hypothetical protein
MVGELLTAGTCAPRSGSPSPCARWWRSPLPEVTAVGPYTRALNFRSLPAATAWEHADGEDFVWRIGSGGACKPRPSSGRGTAGSPIPWCLRVRRNNRARCDAPRRSEADHDRNHSWDLGRGTTARPAMSRRCFGKRVRPSGTEPSRPSATPWHPGTSRGLPGQWNPRSGVAGR